MLVNSFRVIRSNQKSNFLITVLNFITDSLL